MRIYLDACCLNRPFDDLCQDRIRLEAESVQAILRRIEGGQWEGVKSPVVQYEIAKMPDLNRLIEVGLMASRMTISVSLTACVRDRARILENLGVRGVDALHLACAEHSKADVFLTTDDALLKRARRCQSDIKVAVDNPLRWFERVVRR